MDNGKEFTRQILAEMAKMAKQIFAKITVQEAGTFTAYELWKCKDAMGNILHIDWNGTEHDRYAATVGTFKFEFAAQEVFETVYKFEKLCNVRQADKMRFTYGNAENEIVNEKATYYTGNMERGNYNHETGCNEVIGNGNYKVVTRKVSLKKLSEKLAVDKKERPYYKSGDVWYITSDRPLPEKITDRLKNEPDYLFGLLSKFDFSAKCELNPIYKALYEAMKSERANSTPEQRKSENEPENTVIYDENNTNIEKLSENIGKDEESRVYVRIKNTWHQLVGFGGYDAESIAEKGVGELLYLKSVLEEMKRGESGICEQNDKILSMLSEDYPPEPYNKEKSENVATSHERLQSQTICGHAEKSANSCGNGRHVLPGYLRQKVFPTKLFYARRKISRFKPRYFAVYTNYHLCEESALERERISNTSVYRVLIRGETKNNIHTCRQTCFRL